MEIGYNLTLTKFEGRYGRYVQLQRGKRRINISKTTWTTFIDNLDTIKTLSLQSIRATDQMEINVVNFKEKAYVSFHDCFVRHDRVFDCYINLNKQEFDKLLACVSDLSTFLYEDKAMDVNVPDTVLPEKEVKLRQLRDYCNKCHDMTRAIVVNSKGRSRQTMLGAQEFLNLLKSTGLRCHYCGEEPRQGNCHCHRFDCKKCEKDNFCKRCDGVLYYESQFSKI